MGRGRAKAKQTKVARELKYSSPNTDFDSLQRELSGGESPISHRNGVLSEKPDDVSRWEEDEYEDWRR
ncbi:DUF3073 domain-containing protein [Aldersonia sp. NBC_00410]|jgi:hypothetical protein|uniref:DUF3073 domain-containing protein n=1 Tax=Aldersonia sp. NBC_00410 TaxID=2975954 RepID=UPI00225BEC85|nr:DUF3073 domain-containing protein [Aldersonia sp. NBC_00410]MCX5043434.1 DUF3073 domain-containing protein [Aldersonia sp. NBC_00410]